MHRFVHEIATAHTPESLAAQLRGEPGSPRRSEAQPGLVILRSGLFDVPQARYSFVTARPFLTFRSFGSHCEIRTAGRTDVQFGNPWKILDLLMARFELLDEIDLPFPLGGCFGYWGYDLKNFTEPKLPRRTLNDLDLPDCHVGFHDNLVVFDHHLAKTWIVSTGFNPDGSRNEARAREQVEFWKRHLSGSTRSTSPDGEIPGDAQFQTPVRRLPPLPGGEGRGLSRHSSAFGTTADEGQRNVRSPEIVSNLKRAEFLRLVRRAQDYIRAGHIYQVNLAQRLSVPCPFSGWELFERMLTVSPSPFAAYLDCGDFQIASSSPELFLHLTGSKIQTRPIKGTRPRDADPTRDAQLAYELQTSPKELAELVMITDLLRNDLGRVCEYGSISVPDLARLERYAHVQHLVSTIEGRLRPEITHFAALASCFPGGSITGAPKFRAMEIIDELEPVTRGPYTGCHGYLGFNRESQLSISIRTAICKDETAWFHAGAGIVADSIPESEYEETLAKARGFIAALELQAHAPSLSGNR